MIDDEGKGKSEQPTHVDDNGCSGNTKKSLPLVECHQWRHVTLIVESNKSRITQKVKKEEATWYIHSNDSRELVERLKKG